MNDFLTRFADGTDPQTGGPAFSNVRSGTIVGLLSIGTLIGAIVGAPIANAAGRKLAIVFWCIIFIVGVIVQIATSTTWYQIAIGRWVAGLGVGGLSVLTPMYQSETAPRQIRGAMVSCYQLFITMGICTHCPRRDKFLQHATVANTHSCSSCLLHQLRHAWRKVHELTGLLAHSHGHWLHLPSHHGRGHPLFA